MTGDGEEQDELEALIAWDVAGTLGAADAKRLQAALARDPALAASHAAALEELAAATEANEALGRPSARALDQLLAKLDAEPARRRAPGLDLAGTVGRFFASLSPRTLALTAAAAAAVILLQAGLIGRDLISPPATPPATYVTASAPRAPAPAGAALLVRFRPNATSAAITAFLTTHDAAIVDGPTADGFYRVRVSPRPLDPTRLSAISDAAQRDPVVDFAAPAG